MLASITSKCTAKSTDARHDKAWTHQPAVKAETGYGDLGDDSGARRFGFSFAHMDVGVGARSFMRNSRLGDGIAGGWLSRRRQAARTAAMASVPVASAAASPTSVWASARASS